MKIKMTTTSCGPDPKYNFNEGQKRNVTEEEARYWHEKGYCELLEPYPSTAQKAVVAPPERAVVRPAETAKSKVTAEPVKPPVAPPASSGNTVASNAVGSNKAATWGTGGSK